MEENLVEGENLKHDIYKMANVVQDLTEKIEPSTKNVTPLSDQNQQLPPKISACNDLLNDSQVNSEEIYHNDADVLTNLMNIEKRKIFSCDVLSDLNRFEKSFNYDSCFESEINNLPNIQRSLLSLFPTTKASKVSLNTKNQLNSSDSENE